MLCFLIFEFRNGISFVSFFVQFITAPRGGATHTLGNNSVLYPVVRNFKECYVAYPE